MRVSLLGPFRVEMDGRVLVPSAPKLRQALSLLAVNAGRVVSSEQLIEELWNDRPPASATTTLQTYVYQLRKLYRLNSGGRADGHRSGGGPALRTSPTGYMLTLAEDAVDSANFVRLADRARAELDSGALEPAVDTLRVALRLWRGPALAEVMTGPLLHAVTVWLEEQRRGLTMQRIDADLALFRHHELIGELTAMVAEQPTDESLRSRLMLALYRAGRRTEALRVYQEAREILATELGLEPMPELQRIHQAVLLADPSVDERLPGATMVVAYGTGEPPDQLPPDVARLIGRHAEVSVVSEALAAEGHTAAPVVVVTGPPGSGKTTLCVHVAHRLRSRYPDGLFHARVTDDEGNPLDPGDVLGSFLRAAGYSPGSVPASLPERVSLFRSWSAGRRVLVVLDDVAGSGLLASLLPTGRSCGTLIAARRRLSDPTVVTTVHLAPLEHADAVQLLVSMLGAERVNGQMAAATSLIELCEGLPLALREAAAQLELKPHWSIDRQVRRTRATESEGGVRRSLCRTVRVLREELRAAFCGLAGLGRPVSLHAVMRLLGDRAARAEELVEELATFGLVQIEAVADSPDSFVYRVPRPYADAIGVDGTAGRRALGDCVT